MNTAAERPLSLLLVEENEVIRESLGEWICVMFPDVRLIEATNHRAGISLSQSELPDIVVIDISALGKGGIEAVRGVKAAHPSAPILALVTLDHESYRQAVLRAGAEECTCIWNVHSELLPQLEGRLGPG
jgi:DNA-binding NarL/FixJ family response regulator